LAAISVLEKPQFESGADDCLRGKKFPGLSGKSFDSCANKISCPKTNMIVRNEKIVFIIFGFVWN
jgi:hypothetical protein